MLRIDPTKVLWKEVDGLVVILLISAGNFLELNKSGSVIWRMIAEGTPIDHIAAKMATLFDAPAEKLQTDVNSFISQMKTQGFITD